MGTGFRRSPLGAQTVKMLFKQILRYDLRKHHMLKEFTEEFTKCCPGAVQSLIVTVACNDDSEEILVVSGSAPGVDGSHAITVQVLPTGENSWVDVFSSNSLEVDNGLFQIAGINVVAYVNTSIVVRVLIDSEQVSAVTKDVEILAC